MLGGGWGNLSYNSRPQSPGSILPDSSFPIKTCCPGQDLCEIRCWEHAEMHRAQRLGSVVSRPTRSGRQGRDRSCRTRDLTPYL